MTVLRSLRRGLGGLRRNPILFVPPFVLMLIEIPQLLLQRSDPLHSLVVSLLVMLVVLFVLPFFQGGMVGMAAEALDGRTSLATFTREGRANYVSLFVAYLVLIAINFVLGIVLFIASLVAVIGLFQAGSVHVGATTPLVAGVIFAAIFLVYLVVLFFIQFYAQAIVLDDAGATSGFVRSYSLVRQHILSTVGFTVVLLVVGGLLGAVFGAVSILVTPQPYTTLSLPHPSTGVLVGVLIGVLAVGTFVGGFFATYSVAFYRAIDPETAGSASDEDPARSR